LYLKWLKGGDIDAKAALPESERLAKTGWGTHKIWVSNPYKKAKHLAAEYKVARKRESVLLSILLRI